MEAPPLTPPISPMLARLARELPIGDYAYEPKWDGFRCLAFAAGGGVDLRSRNQRPFARYFPEIVAALELLPRPGVLDGELVVLGDGCGFEALLARLHPSASRVAHLARLTPAMFVAFDLLADGRDDLRACPFAERRRRLEMLLAGLRPPAEAHGDRSGHGRSSPATQWGPRGCLGITPATLDPEAARAWLDAVAGGPIDGVVAKRRDLPYAAGRRAMVKLKREHTADCVVAGFRTYAQEPAVASLLLGLWDGCDLVHVGVSSSFRDAERMALYELLRRGAVAMAGHPWARGFNVGAGLAGRLKGAAGRWDPSEMTLDWTPIAPERVAEVAYDRLDGVRFRHPPRFVRWRLDRDPRSCTVDQLAPPDERESQAGR